MEENVHLCLRWLAWFSLVAISTLKDPTWLVYAVYAPNLYPIRGPGSGLYPICTPMKCPQRPLSLGMDCWWLEDLPFTLLSCPAEMVSSCQWNICHYLRPTYTTIRGHGPYLLLGLQSGTTHYQWDWKWDTYIHTGCQFENNNPWIDQCSMTTEKSKN